MKKIKKIILMILLLTIVGLIVLFIINSTSPTVNTTNKNVTAKSSQDNTTENKTSENNTRLVIGDNYFIAQLNDIYYNKDDYDGKEIEIEGFPLSTSEYKFIGRYGPGCCVGDGYAYIEYQYDKDIELTDIQDWIKVIGTLRKANDGNQDYVYIDVDSIEKLSIRGEDTVQN